MILVKELARRHTNKQSLTTKTASIIGASRLISSKGSRRDGSWPRRRNRCWNACWLGGRWWWTAHVVLSSRISTIGEHIRVFTSTRGTIFVTIATPSIQNITIWHAHIGTIQLAITNVPTVTITFATCSTKCTTKDANSCGSSCLVYIVDRMEQSTGKLS